MHMDVSKEDLAERFNGMSDDALVARVQAGTMTPLALEVALAELRSRGIDVAADIGTPAEHDDSAEPSEDDIDLVTVARFTNPLKANILRACLESHGIFAFLWGEHLGTA